MINVDFLTTEKGYLVGFDIYGHAEYSALGQDIVCAAVSSAAFLAVNTILDVIKVPAETHVDKFGAIYLKIDKRNVNLCNDILSGLKLHLVNLEEQYPENIIVNYVEV